MTVLKVLTLLTLVNVVCTIMLVWIVVLQYYRIRHTEVIKLRAQEGVVAELAVYRKGLAGLVVTSAKDLAKREVLWTTEARELLDAIKVQLEVLLKEKA